MAAVREGPAVRPPPSSDLEFRGAGAGADVGLSRGGDEQAGGEAGQGHRPAACRYERDGEFTLAFLDGREAQRPGRQEGAEARGGHREGGGTEIAQFLLLGTRRGGAAHFPEEGVDDLVRGREVPPSFRLAGADEDLIAPVNRDQQPGAPHRWVDEPATAFADTPA